MNVLQDVVSVLLMDAALTLDRFIKYTEYFLLRNRDSSNQAVKMYDIYQYDNNLKYIFSFIYSFE